MKCRDSETGYRMRGPQSPHSPWFGGRKKQIIQQLRYFALQWEVRAISFLKGSCAATWVKAYVTFRTYSVSMKSGRKPQASI